MDRRVPVGQLAGSFSQLQEEGCIQCEFDSLFEQFNVLMLHVANNPCNGCPVWSEKGEACRAYQKYHTNAIRQREEKAAKLANAVSPGLKNGIKYANMTVAEVARSLGISKGEVRRRKQAGTL